MPGKLARRHFSQLSEFERGLIIGMKTAGRGRYPRAENRVWSDQEDHEERGSKDRVQKLVDPKVTRSMIRADVGVAIVPQTISRHLAEANIKSKRRFRALPLTLQAVSMENFVIAKMLRKCTARVFCLQVTFSKAD
ncbi:HTH_Tnp_Tc3_2 domain-containing protein [Trichonephila clavipes]|nr:HTH_Tnp_Tc3_2 domain-containing protein [Trichonephila clavipes]